MNHKKIAFSLRLFGWALWLILMFPSFSGAETTMFITRDSKPVASIVLRESSPVMDFAAAELSSYIAKISGATLKLERNTTDHLKGCIVLAKHSGEFAIPGMPQPPSEREMFIVQCDGQNLFILGGSDRAVLYGVYAFLEHLGCRWFYPRPEEEVVPNLPTIQVNKIRLAEKPEMALRGLYFVPIIHRDIQIIKNFIDWMGKRRLNMFLTHPGFYTKHLCDIIQWPNVREQILPEIKKRGIMLNMSLHTALYHFPPDKYFSEHPEWFALVNGKRQPSQICYSNRQAVDAYAQSITEYARKNPQVDIIGCWPMDGLGYCECNDCKQPDLILEAVNEVARRVKKVRPDVIVEHLLYHISNNLPTRVLPESNVLVLWCGRDSEMKEWADVCKRAGSKGVYQLEYMWGNKYNFKGSAKLCPSDVVQSLKTTVENGLIGITPLFIPTYNWWRSGLNIYVFSQIAWNHDADLDEILNDYYHRYYREASAPMKTYFGLWWNRIVDPGAKYEKTKYGTINIKKHENNKAAFTEARAALDKADGIASNADLRARLKKARLYLDYNEKWLTAQHFRWQLLQAVENRDKVKALAASAAIDRLEKRMVWMCRHSCIIGDGVLGLGYPANDLHLLEKDKELIIKVLQEGAKDPR